MCRAVTTGEKAKDLAANPGPADRNGYGGWTAGPQLKATGRFRTEKIGGRKKNKKVLASKNAM